MSAIAQLKLPVNVIGLMGLVENMPDGGAMFRMIGIVVLLAAAFAVLDPLGYRLTALFFITLMLLVLGVRNYLAIGLVALALSFGVFHSFYYWLKVPLPIGEFGL